jgi:hypothetical protein
VVITSRDHSKAKGVTNKVQDKKKTKRNEAITIEKTNKEGKENKMDRKKLLLHYVPHRPAHVNMNFWYLEKYLAIKVKAMTVVFWVMIPTTNMYRIRILSRTFR